VTLFGAFHPLYMLHNNPNTERINLFQIFWMAVFIGSSLFSFSWDVFMDWGLGVPEYQFLGPRLMYPKRINYYYVIAIDFGELLGLC
jgi:EXS family